MSDSSKSTTRARTAGRSPRGAADYVYQAATVAAALLMLLTATL